MREAEDVSGSIDRLASPLQKSAIEVRFTQMAEALDAAGLGPADYLYAPLKWRVQKPEVGSFSFRRALWRAVKEAMSNLPPVPLELPRAPILIASSSARVRQAPSPGRRGLGTGLRGYSITPRRCRLSLYRARWQAISEPLLPLVRPSLLP